MKREVIAELSAASLVHNYQVAKKNSPNSEVYAVVKANAYGHGMGWVVETLAELADGFAVATLQEGVQCRIEAGMEAPVLVMQGVFNASDIGLAQEMNLELGVHSPEQVEILKAYPSFAAGRPVALWIKLNTGMNRLGLCEEQVGRALEVLESCSNYKISGVFSHFASADRQSSLNGKQLEKFKQITAQVQKCLGQEEAVRLKKSAANSAALLSIADSHFDVTRPGIMLYGSSPLKGKTAGELDLKPVMKLKAYIIGIQEVKTGESVGYGETWKAGKDSVIAAIGIGYGDGYPRGVDEYARVQIGEKLFPVVGTVSMDTLTVDISGAGDIKVGDEVVLWGDLVSADEIAESARTISYELFCKITDRAGRRHING